MVYKLGSAWVQQNTHKTYNMNYGYSETDIHGTLIFISNSSIIIFIFIIEAITVLINVMQLVAVEFGESNNNNSYIRYNNSNYIWI